MAIKKGGLGKGLGGLFNANNVTEEALEHTKSVTKKVTDGESIVLIELPDIEANPFQPRHHFNDDKLQELAQSIKENGVLTPIIVRRYNNKYQIIAGERRVRASKLADLVHISAIIRNVDDDTMAAVALIENLQRDDLDAIEEAQAYDGLMKQLQLTQTQVAEKIGKDRTTVTNALRLLKLPQTVQTLVEAGDLSMGHARALLGLKDKTQIEKIAQSIVTQGLNVRQVESLVRNMNDGSTDKTVKIVSPFAMSVATQLEEKFGTKVKVNAGNKGNGKIEINYMSNDDLSRILNLLDIEVD
ncbi:MAG: ParB/RepB/Spo0J family partition protein [Leuconostoc gelidum]|jgi:ParB family chromosome partitioning protein|uniref:ParB/RepB/Spo0J family partition protein n=1 Tax=Leuconostoc gelidum subsp. gelidum TaxID=1607839 RepID=A0AB35FYL5_LEUGE|nr:ParB/RepB/Spo0J family partition protein [Leuconostoc gelidum]AFS40996.1 chromosome partitioning protein ParB [Leuconostoc gelidum JB7]MBZ5964221.1 ParB/RepB/Spo0J family partition protein [Leuconostoc gelidum subsp. gelidum]MBZ5975738.1 ParB/RepB/Spo0J family partition protein [Leuconostoc gelidum subsp. gelidum]MBZ5976783.1 ParB/RepB/Spo0J family partition protein [Leuconostoc gelidum subsp. gelidum]MBZ5979067.1 ParB/RepB/Spo0J family partition protein [Leuconostoc gelidum subsp. gelidum]